jgi:23S rRNA U2552 (ribose-2'-O)-methylase RlmE/FtsJ
MSNSDKFIDELRTYNLLLFDLNTLKKPKPSDFNINAVFSNNFCYPQYKLGFINNIHQIKEDTKVLNNFNNRKKVYLVTSLFEKSIDYTNNSAEINNDFEHSIDNALSIFIKSIDKNYPAPLNRAFLKFWEMIVLFDLIPNESTFTSSHLAEGPGSFIQATILYREFLKKSKKISTTKNDNYYGVTLFSDHDYLQMQKKFIDYIESTKPKQLHIFDNSNVENIDDMYGGGGGKDSSDEIDYENLATFPSNGDITKLNTILQFSGSQNKLSDLVTADGGFDWVNENLQEQEAYSLILGQVVTALKSQNNGGNFIIKIFESYTPITVKIIEFLRSFYDCTYIYKPYTSRISNSEKYVVCKNFNRKLFTPDISNKLDILIKNINQNKNFNILDIFTNVVLNDNQINIYNDINSSFLVKQYIGINNILEFVNLDNYNGVEYNTYLQKQIVASYFWNSTFLNPSLFPKLHKYCKKYDYLTYDFANNDIFINYYKIDKNNEDYDNKPMVVAPITDNKKLKEEEDETFENKTKSSTMKRQTTKTKTKSTKKSVKQKGGGNESEDRIDNSRTSKKEKEEEHIINMYGGGNSSDISSDEMIIGTLDDDDKN